jgi:hypothetical protein
MHLGYRRSGTLYIKLIKTYNLKISNRKKENFRHLKEVIKLLHHLWMDEYAPIMKYRKWNFNLPHYASYKFLSEGLSPIFNLAPMNTHRKTFSLEVVLKLSIQSISSYLQPNDNDFSRLLVTLYPQERCHILNHKILSLTQSIRSEEQHTYGSWNVIAKTWKDEVLNLVAPFMITEYTSNRDKFVTVPI